MTHKFELKGKRSVQDKAGTGCRGKYRCIPEKFQCTDFSKTGNMDKNIFKKNKKTRWLKLPTLSLLFIKSTRTK